MRCAKCFAKARSSLFALLKIKAKKIHKINTRKLICKFVYKYIEFAYSVRVTTLSNPQTCDTIEMSRQIEVVNTGDISLRNNSDQIRPGGDKITADLKF